MLAIAVGAGAEPSEVAGTVSGPARALDADILILGRSRVILWGIDAPERPQTCSIDGRFWGGHDAAKRALESLAGRGEVTGMLLRAPGTFNRCHGICLSGGQDIAAETVRARLALAYIEQTSDCEAQQVGAIIAGVGLWQPGAAFVEPWVFRRSNAPGGLR